METGGKSTGASGFIAAAGATLGQYTLLRELGAGGMGRVFEAEHLELGKRVAVKLLHPALAASPKAVRRFLREGRACSRIVHPHVVQVLDTGVHEGQPYLVMDLVKGTDLATWLREKQRLDTGEIADVFLPLCSALWAVHGSGVVHRDVKPSNVILTRPRSSALHPVLVDFGVAKLSVAEAPDDQTKTDCAVGTVAYMAPEQTRGTQAAQPTLDQYALGVMLYECATGRRPFQGETQYDLMHAILHDEVVPPSRHRPDLDPAFDTLVLRALNRAPAERFPTVHALGAALLSLAGAKAWTTWGPEFCGTDGVAGKTQSDAADDKPPVSSLESSPAVMTWGSAAQPVSTVSRRSLRLKVLAGVAAFASVALVAVIWLTPGPDAATALKLPPASAAPRPIAVASFSRALAAEPSSAPQPARRSEEPQPSIERNERNGLPTRSVARPASKAPARSPAAKPASAEPPIQKSPQGASADPEPPRGTNGAFILE